MAVNIGRFGLWTTSARWPDDPRERADAAADVDALGFGAVWLGDATADLGLPAALLDATRHLGAVTAILNVWTEPTDIVAASYARVTKSRPNRLLLGFGTGYPAFAGEGYWYPYQAVVDHLDRLDVERPTVPRDVRVLAALGPQMLRFAATHTAGAHPYLVTPQHTSWARDILGAGPLLAPEQKVILTTDPAQARTIARRVLSIYLALPNYTDNLARFGFSADDFASGGSDRLVDSLVAWGDLDRIRSRVDEHHQAGADHVALQVLTDSPDTLPRAQWRSLATGLGLRP
ncbi:MULTISPECIES: LLM class F420-dependent oxidoreductase [unclassified Pseudofrankia]|uniref:LLM class F420-dependent oxidoreductase n=1 Tax=unclassified Pseudofrankia TaxID=2994372 RepID=UPI0008DA702B|nr:MULTISPECIES: LLM class F420-dependent oxidoreductase [unclassified Pseudofrankia]MDT3439987.1 LLM class F420-dependent oxidoreductase [Pseudofrankia sp. BMG5.37]OHV48482.1 LLM class F420-dependent oxidoreductase [Pseudofrankia sp. BMG5.36]